MKGAAIALTGLECGVTVSTTSAHERQNLAAPADDSKVTRFDAAAAKPYGSTLEAIRDRNKFSLDKLIAAHAVQPSQFLLRHKSDAVRPRS